VSHRCIVHVTTGGYRLVEHVTDGGLAGANATALAAQLFGELRLSYPQSDWLDGAEQLGTLVA
jgi:hypothetical protein